MYVEKGEYDRAIQDLDQAIKLKPEYSRAFRNRGDAYRKKGDLDHASADYQKALSLNPSDSLRKDIQTALEELGEAGKATAPSSSSTPNNEDGAPRAPASGSASEGAVPAVADLLSDQDFQTCQKSSGDSSNRGLRPRDQLGQVHW